MKRALVTLTPPEGKRLIARAVAAMPEVQDALKHGFVYIATGTTAAYVPRRYSARTSRRRSGRSEL